MEVARRRRGRSGRLTVDVRVAFLFFLSHTLSIFFFFFPFDFYVSFLPISPVCWLLLLAVDRTVKYRTYILIDLFRDGVSLHGLHSWPIIAWIGTRKGRAVYLFVSLGDRFRQLMRSNIIFGLRTILSCCNWIFLRSLINALIH